MKKSLIYSILTNSFNIKKIKEEIFNNYNILLLGKTNVGKSTLINEFLKLEKGRAEEGKGGPTNIIDFKPYIKIKNNIKYTLYDTNGITNKGKDSINNKIDNIKKEIAERIISKNPNNFIHCIWYCFSGSYIQESDRYLIKELLNIYTVFSIPIIFVHCLTFSKHESEISKKVLKKYLLDIFKDELKVKEYLKKKYINVLARGDNTKNNDEDEEDDDDNFENNIKAFGLDKLEKRSREEINEEGKKSAYSEYIKNYILTFLINGAFRLIFPESNINLLLKAITKDIKKYVDEIEKIINNDKFKLSDDIKNNNKESLTKIYNSFNNIKDNLKNEMKNLLKMDNLKRDNLKFIEDVYNEKTAEFKNSMNFADFCKNVENLIYDNISHNSNEIINNLLNLNFNHYIFQVIKEGIKGQLKKKEKEMLDNIYSKLVLDDKKGNN